MTGDPSPWPRRPRPSANPALLTAPPALSLPLSCLPLTSPSYSAPLTKGSGTHGGPSAVRSLIGHQGFWLRVTAPHCSLRGVGRARQGLRVGAAC